MGKQLKEDFVVLDNYFVELKLAKLGSNVFFVSQRQDGYEFPIF